MRKRLSAQIAAGRTQNIPAVVEDMDADRRAMLIAGMPELGRMTAG